MNARTILRRRVLYSRADTVVGVHVGVHKTGTSALQSFLADHRHTTLPRHRVRYLRRRVVAELIGPWGDALAADPGPLAERFRTLADHRWSQTVLASNENIVGRPFGPGGRGRLYPAAPDNLAALGVALDGLRGRIVVTLRPQHEFVESCYLQTIHQGGVRTFADWFSRVDPGALSWHPVVDAARAAVGPENVEIVDFGMIRSGQQEYLHHVLQKLDPRLDVPVHHSEAHNRSLSARGLEIALAVNPLLETDTERHAVRLLLQEHFPNTKSQRPVLLSDEQRADLVERYADEYAELVA